MNCCANPVVRKLSMHREFTHKLCDKCGSHQYGHGEGQLINKKDWEEWVNHPSEDGMSFDEFKRERDIA